MTVHTEEAFEMAFEDYLISTGVYKKGNTMPAGQATDMWLGTGNRE